MTILKTAKQLWVYEAFLKKKKKRNIRDKKLKICLHAHMGLSVRELAGVYSSEKCLCLSALCSANLTRTWKAESRPPHFAQVGLCVLFQRYECTHLNLPRRALTFLPTSQTTNRAEVSLMHKTLTRLAGVLLGFQLDKGSGRHPIQGQHKQALGKERGGPLLSRTPCIAAERGCVRPLS